MPVILFALALLLPLAAGPAVAQPRPADPTEVAREEKRQRERDLETLRLDMERAAATKTRIEAEIAALRNDRAGLVRASIDAAAKVRGREAEVVETEARLTRHAESEGRLRSTLEARRGLIAEVMAALQRMGRRPPPALLVAPEDVLKSLRTAMLLGTLVPEMRDAMVELARDLSELSNVRRQIETDRDRLRREIADLDGERLRLEALAEARQSSVSETEKALDTEKLRVVGLARQAGNLEHLIGRMETEIAAAVRAAEAARTSTQTRQATPADRRAQMAALANVGRMAPAVAFEQMRGQLLVPVLGVRLREFGAPDGLGGTERGLSIATRPGANVTAPADGWVVYSGPFRGYGQLLILNAGAGYHLVLAGMDKITVDLGQFVLLGEPVAVMGAAPPPAAQVATGSTQPVLYVEFRKDGVTIDPAPWWTSRPAGTATNERVRG